MSVCALKLFQESRVALGEYLHFRHFSDISVFRIRVHNYNYIFALRWRASKAVIVHAEVGSRLFYVKQSNKNQ